MPVSPVLHTNISLADHHAGEQFLVEDALEKIPGSFNLTVARNGVESIDLLNQHDSQAPGVLFPVNKQTNSLAKPSCATADFKCIRDQQ